jgi:hypothetical protein
VTTERPDELELGERDDDHAKVIAFYLPQFHPVPENDAWWGKGFTEWSNVVKARPLFDGHYQPHLPGDLGFYDLRVPEVREQQAALARAHGIDGFCYYHYWFGGRRVLDRVFDEVLRSRSPNFPFCLCWANENWTRAWDAGDHEILLKQDYGADEREEHVRYLVDAFRDDRYIRVDRRPLFLIYRIQALPEAGGFLERLRRVSMDAGLGDPYVVKFDTHGNFDAPAHWGCDAAAQFLPHGVGEMVEPITVRGAHTDNHIYDYGDVANVFLHEPAPDWIRHECVFPGWDNTPRRGDGRSLVVHHSTPELFERWLRAAYNRAPDRGGLLFVNAWNEWAEGAHLEPDERHGLAYLRATARAVLGHEPPREPMGSLGASESVLLGPRFSDLFVDLYDRCVKMQRRLTASEAMLQRYLEGDVKAEELEQALELNARLRVRIEELEARLVELEVSV